MKIEDEVVFKVANLAVKKLWEKTLIEKVIEEGFTEKQGRELLEKLPGNHKPTLQNLKAARFALESGLDEDHAKWFVVIANDEVIWKKLAKFSVQAIGDANENYRVGLTKYNNALVNE